MIEVNLEIGFIPKKYYEKAPSTGGYNFFINDGINYAINIGDMYYPKYTEELLALFTTSLVPFPLYYLFEQQESDFLQDLKQSLTADHLQFEVFSQTEQSTFLIVTISNHQELVRLIPTMIWQHNYNPSTLWSNHKNAFTIENKTWDLKAANGEYSSIEKTICLNFTQPTTVFWLGHDFKGTDIFSNEDRFSNLENIQKLLPSFINTEIIELG